MKTIVKLLFSFLTTLNIIIHGIRQWLLFWFCTHLDTEQITYYKYDHPTTTVYRSKICKTCGCVVECYEVSRYLDSYNREKIAKRLESKGIKNLEDLYC